LGLPKPGSYNKPEWLQYFRGQRPPGPIVVVVEEEEEDYDDDDDDDGSVSWG
jgi:hypothetical protein